MTQAISTHLSILLPKESNFVLLHFWTANHSNSTCRLVLHNQRKQPILKKHVKQLLIDLAKTAAIPVMSMISKPRDNRVCLRSSVLALICFSWTRNPKSKKSFLFYEFLFINDLKLINKLWFCFKNNNIFSICYFRWCQWKK